MDLDLQIQYVYGEPESKNVALGSKTLIEIFIENDLIIDSDGNKILVDGNGIEITVIETETVSDIPDIPELPPVE